MKKLLSILIAGVFAASTSIAFAQAPKSGTEKATPATPATPAAPAAKSDVKKDGAAAPKTEKGEKKAKKKAAKKSKADKAAEKPADKAAATPAKGTTDKK